MRQRPAWHAAVVGALAPETAEGRRVTLRVPTWPGNDAGQHLDIRLTAPDGYQASRSYSIASVGSGTQVELAVERVQGGEVSPFLVDELRAEDQIEVRGPLGGWFVWRADDGDDRPVQLVAGGSGVVPMVAMLRAHATAASGTPMRLLHAVRSPAQAFYAEEIDRIAAVDETVLVERVFSRSAPPAAARPAGRLTAALLAELAVPASERPRLFVCGSTPFVEQVLRWLTELGYDVGDARAERFGGAR